MSDSASPQAILLLEDGTVFYGKPAGKIGTTTGEICFNTGMTGYQEVFTDPSYYGQILVMTADHIGNYGTDEEEVEADRIMIAGMVCKNFSGKIFSRKKADWSIQEYLEEQGLVSICELDTRAVVRHIRHKGAMNAIISSEINDLEILKEMLAKVPSMAGLELSSKVSTKNPYFYGNPDAAYRIAVLDLGVKQNILRCFASRDVYMKVFPSNATYAEMKEWAPDGYFFSNGPGDPAAMQYAINTVKEVLAADEPLFGICLGNQLLALANDIPTYKMFNGHRGLNHPVKNLQTGLCEITSQNHGFSVDMEKAQSHPDIEVTHINLNDKTVAGIKMKSKKAFSVQYHPESGPGPHDSRYLFDEFIQTIKQRHS
ncbi:MAG: glutamine-hydrolyzing carbamoyl-phosphate synthase small subunit [Chitinophagales bacterium]|nr:glutamine-hydrolyzing carbamoyl-phosphate synthase small subunit [Chitinophagales bacterium]